MASLPITSGSRWNDLHPALLTYANLREESRVKADPTFRDTFMRYVQHHRGRARKLLDLWESEPTRPDEFCGKSRALSFVRSLRAFLKNHDLLPKRPPGWVDPLGEDQYEAMKEVRMEMHELRKIKSQKEAVSRRLEKVRKQVATADGPSGINSDRLPHANHPLVRSTGAQERPATPAPQTSERKRKNRNLKKRFYALKANDLRRVSGDYIRRTMFPRGPDADQPTAASDADQPTVDPASPMATGEIESEQFVVEAGPSNKRTRRSRSKKKKQRKIREKLMKKVYIMAKRWVRENRIEVDESEISSSGVSDGPSDLESEEDTPTTGPSPARSSPVRPSPARSSPASSSPAKSSPARLSPARPSPARLSPARPSPARSPPVKSPTPAPPLPTSSQPGLPTSASASLSRDSRVPSEPPKTQPPRRNVTEWDVELGHVVQVTDEHGRPMRRVVSPPGTNVIVNYSGRPTLRPTLPVKRPAPIKSRLGPRFVRPTPALKPQPTVDDDEIQVVYKKHPEQVAQDRWVAMMKREELKQAQVKEVRLSYRPVLRKEPEPAHQTEPQPTKKKFKPAAMIAFDQ
jgi:hypothetical protein